MEDMIQVWRGPTTQMLNLVHVKFRQCISMEWMLHIYIALIVSCVCKAWTNATPTASLRDRSTTKNIVDSDDIGVSKLPEPLSRNFWSGILYINAEVKIWLAPVLVSTCA